MALLLKSVTVFYASLHLEIFREKTRIKFDLLSLDCHMAELKIKNALKVFKGFILLLWGQTDGFSLLTI